ncbi:hypothetical protein C8T65DRAFT_90400 [Cerioporus squamosus]|nr:hypothetical protein C8T65DRAFT_90400 [Cerioporus squamosus]
MDIRLPSRCGPPTDVISWTTFRYLSSYCHSRRSLDSRTTPVQVARSTRERQSSRYRFAPSASSNVNGVCRDCDLTMVRAHRVPNPTTPSPRGCPHRWVGCGSSTSAGRLTCTLHFAPFSQHCPLDASLPDARPPSSDWLPPLFDAICARSSPGDVPTSHGVCQTLLDFRHTASPPRRNVHSPGKPTPEDVCPCSFRGGLAPT